MLSVYAKGTVVTKYYEYEETDQDGHRHKRTDKNEQEFIDRLEYKIVFRGQIMYQWSEPGDTAMEYGSTANYSFGNPLYDLTYVGGFWKPSYTVCRTKTGCDPALAMLIAHLCNTEYSNSAIKKDLKVSTPGSYPHGFTFRMF